MMLFKVRLHNIGKCYPATHCHLSSNITEKPIKCVICLIQFVLCYFWILYQSMHRNLIGNR